MQIKTGSVFDSFEDAAFCFHVVIMPMWTEE